jgi:Nitronate monooxygenase
VIPVADGAVLAIRHLTPFCQRLGLTAPVVQAPVGGATTPELAAAVSNAGGLGMLAMSWTPVGAVRERIRATRALTDRPFGVNVVLEWDQHERVRACAEESVAVVSTFWGDPRPYVDAIHAGGALHAHTVGCAEEARRAVEAGVDVVVAQGWEAGGRVWGKVATLALVPAVVDAVRPVPVLAAGGVAMDAGSLPRLSSEPMRRGWALAFCLRKRQMSTTSGGVASKPLARPAPCTRRSSIAAGRMRRTVRCATAPFEHGSVPDDRPPPGAPARATWSRTHPTAAASTATAPTRRWAARPATWRHSRSTPARARASSTMSFPPRRSWMS